MLHTTLSLNSSPPRSSSTCGSYETKEDRETRELRYTKAEEAGETGEYRLVRETGKVGRFSGAETGLLSRRALLLSNRRCRGGSCATKTSNSSRMGGSTRHGFLGIDPAYACRASQ